MKDMKLFTILDQAATLNRRKRASLYHANCWKFSLFCRRWASWFTRGWVEWIFECDSI